MTSLYMTLATTMIRAALLSLSGYLVAKGWMAPSDADTFVETTLKHAVQALPFVAVLAVSLWSKYQERLKYIAARLSSPQAGEHEVQQLAKAPVVKELAFVDPKMIAPYEPKKTPTLIIPIKTPPYPMERPKD